MKKTLFRIFKGILIFLLIVLAIAGGILAYNMWLNQTFVTTFYTVTTDKDIENMRIVELSDLHLREYGEKNADLVERIGLGVEREHLFEQRLDMGYALAARHALAARLASARTQQVELHRNGAHTRRRGFHPALILVQKRCELGVVLGTRRDR